MGERAVFSTKDAGTTGYPMDSNSHHIQKQTENGSKT